jgi:hypothetical protein
MIPIPLSPIITQPSRRQRRIIHIATRPILRTIIRDKTFTRFVSQTQLFTRLSILHIRR